MYKMAKNVALSNRAYSVLSKLKKPRESFSDVVVRLAEGDDKPSIRRLVGVWKDDKEVEKAYKEVFELRHKSKSREVRL